jgi:hypothetical protein
VAFTIMRSILEKSAAWHPWQSTPTVVSCYPLRANLVPISSTLKQVNILDPKCDLAINYHSNPNYILKFCGVMAPSNFGFKFLTRFLPLVNKMYVAGS